MPLGARRAFPTECLVSRVYFELPLPLPLPLTRRALPTECHVSGVYLGLRQRRGGCGESEASEAECGCAMRLTTRPGVIGLGVGLG